MIGEGDFFFGIFKLRILFYKIFGEAMKFLLERI